MSSFALNEGLENSKDWEFNEINHYESKLIIDKNTTLSQINRIPNDDDKLDELGLNFTPTSILTSKNITDEHEGVKSVIHPDEMLKGWDENNKAFKLVV